MRLGLRSGFPMAILFASMALAGCRTIKIEIPKVERKAPVEIASSESLAPIKLDRIGVKIRRGTPIGHFKFDHFKCTKNISNMFWNQGRILSKDLEFTDIFYEEMSKVNFNVVENPNKMFREVFRGSQFLHPHHGRHGQAELRGQEPKGRLFKLSHPHAPIHTLKRKRRMSPSRTT